MAGTTTDAANADAAKQARTELRDQLRELLKVVRLVKQHPPTHAAIPGGMVGVLASVDAMSTEPGRSRPGCHVKDLAARNGLDPSTVSRAVATLVRLGLVRRTADPTDGRAVFLAPTPTGRAALHDAHRRQDQQLAEALCDWQPADLTAFIALLRCFNESVLHQLGDPTLTPMTPTPTRPTMEASR